MSLPLEMMTPAVQQAVLAVRAAVGIARLEHLAVLDIQGPDAAKFLQNRLSNDVLALQPGQGHLNAALDRQGKIQGLFSLHRLAEDTFRLLIDKQERENAIAQIEKYHIVEAFKLTDRSDAFASFSIQGPKADALLEALFQGVLAAKEYAWNDGLLLEKPVWLTRRSFSGENGFLILLETESTSAQGFWETLKSKVFAQDGVGMTPEVQEILRIEAGLPRFGMDYDFETLLPETGLEQQAVSYSKGCYLGQETIARVKTYGMVQKALVGLLFEPDVALPAPGSACLLDGKPVGLLQSGCVSPVLQRPIALAYLGKTERIPGKVLSLAINEQVYPVTVTLLPFYDARASQKSGRELLEEGLKRFAEGFDEEALRVLNMAIQTDPELLEAYEALGVILSRQERYTEAIELMEKVLALDPEHVLAHTNLSVFYMKLGDKEKAEEEKAKATMAAFRQKAKAAGLTFDIEAEQRKKEQAALDRLQMFKEALAFNPEDPLGNFGLGSVCLELKRYQEAVAPFEKVIQAQPKHTVAYLSLGKALEALQENTRAREIYGKGIEIAAAKGDLMPLKEMQQRLENLERTDA